MRPGDNYHRIHPLTDRNDHCLQTEQNWIKSSIWLRPARDYYESDSNLCKFAYPFSQPPTSTASHLLIAKLAFRTTQLGILHIWQQVDTDWWSFSACVEETLTNNNILKRSLNLFLANVLRMNYWWPALSLRLDFRYSRMFKTPRAISVECRPIIYLSKRNLLYDQWPSRKSTDRWRARALISGLVLQLKRFTLSESNPQLNQNHTQRHTFHSIKRPG